MVVVAIDGPAGSGKSTVARALADRLGVVHVDTGAYYRAATLAAVESGADPADEEAISALTAAIVITRGEGRTWLEGRDVSDAIRSTAVDEAVSTVAAHPRVRVLLVEQQRAAVPAAGAVVEGRDAGTRIVPNADLKVWLTAAPEVRARRRAREKAAGSLPDRDGVGSTGRLDEAVIAAQNNALAARDHRDHANMGRAEDVREVDTTALTVDEVVERIIGLLEETS